MYCIDFKQLAIAKCKCRLRNENKSSQLFVTLEQNYETVKVFKETFSETVLYRKQKKNHVTQTRWWISSLAHSCSILHDIQHTSKTNYKKIKFLPRDDFFS